tara:strand:+ start:4546 stop:6852 length:2307 start_codon:yes stop_codon:yes gene_type:complete
MTTLIPQGFFPLTDTGNRYSFFHQFFKGLYPEMYKDVLKNLGQDVESEEDPSPPIPVSTGAALQDGRDDDPYDKARQDALRLQWMMDGKYKIQGQAVTLNVPEFPAGQKGQSASISKFETGIASDPNILSSLFGGMTEKAHAANIQKLMDEGVGGAGLVWSPTGGFSSVSLSVNKRNLLGKEVTTKNLVGNVPDVFIYGDTVYNMQNPLSKKAFITAFENSSQKRATEIKKVESKRQGLVKTFGYYGDDRETVEGSEYATGKASFEKMKKERGFSADAQYFGSEGMGDAYERTPEGVQSAAGLTAEQKQSASDAARDDRERERAENQAKQDAANISDKQASEFASGTQSDVDQMAKDFGYNTGGFIGGMNPDQVTDAQTVADDYPIDSDDGDFMINAAAIERDPQMFNEIISQGLQKAREKGVDVGDISGVGMDGSGDVLASKGEFLVKKPLAETIGYDALNQFNDQGKPEVDRRVAASGGFLDGYANGGDISLPVSKPNRDPDIVRFYNSIKDRFKGSEEARKKTDEIISNFPEEKLLALLSITEASKLGDRGMEAVMHVVNNRAKSDYRNFGKLNSVADVLLQKTGKGAYEFTGLEISGRDEKYDLRVQLSELLSRAGGLKEFDRQVEVAKKVLAGTKRDFTKGSLFFWNPDTSDISPVGLSKEEFEEKVQAGEYLITENIEGSTGRHEHIRPADIPETEYPEESFLRSVETKKRASNQLKIAEDNKMSRFTERLEPLPEPEGLSQKTFLGNILSQGVKPQMGRRN